MSNLVAVIINWLASRANTITNWYHIESPLKKKWIRVLFYLGKFIFYYRGSAKFIVKILIFYGGCCVNSLIKIDVVPGTGTLSCECLGIGNMQTSIWTLRRTTLMSHMDCFILVGGACWCSSWVIISTHHILLKVHLESHCVIFKSPPPPNSLSEIHKEFESQNETVKNCNALPFLNSVNSLVCPSLKGEYFFMPCLANPPTSKSGDLE
jgi:hypothetical protein